MFVHLRSCLVLALALLSLPHALPGQGFRGEVGVRGGWLQLQLLQRDSVPESDVPGDGLRRQLADGTAAVCIEGDWCRWYTSGVIEDITPFTQELSFVAWPGMQGLSFHAHLRGRFGSDSFWPRTEQEVDLLTGYVSYSRPAYQVRAGRLYRRSSLGYHNFDGASLLWRGLDFAWAEAYGGWDLAPGLNAPRTGTLLREADALAPDRRGVLLGAQVGGRVGQLFAGSATYERVIRTDADALYTERVAVDARLLAGGWTADGGLAYDLAHQEVNEGRLQVTTPAFSGVQLVLLGRHYRPFFELWTIWGAFTPVGFNEGRAAVLWTAPRQPLRLEAGGAYRDYEETDAGVGFVPFKEDGWRAYGRVRWTPDAWFVDGWYRAEEGSGAARYGGDVTVGRELGSGTYVALRGSSTETISEFRVGERYVRGGALEGAATVGDLTVDGSIGVYRVSYENRPDMEDWTEGRAQLGVSWRFGMGTTGARGGSRFGGER